MDGDFEIDLPRASDAPWIARHSMADWLGGALHGEQLQTAKLLTSELVTNAVLHGRGRIVLRARLDEDRLLVEVLDEGKGFEHEARRRSFEDLDGRGLLIVDAEASRWGIQEGTTHVWFELERPGPRLGGYSRPAA
jgi:anti-sigma regulatory factor (Ser/Thr protein kinase)